MKTPAGNSTCPKCHGSGLSFVTEQKKDGFAVSWTPCDCNSVTAVTFPACQTLSPVFL